MGMRSSDATFLRREVLPILTRAAGISPEAADAAEALAERLSEPEWPSPHHVVAPQPLHWNSHSPDLRTSQLYVDDCPVPYIEAARGVDWPKGALSLSLDNRYAMDTTEDELGRWAPFLANAMAISAGRTSHGPNSFIRNPHGRSGGGDPPELRGEPITVNVSTPPG